MTVQREPPGTEGHRQDLNLSSCREKEAMLAIVLVANLKGTNLSMKRKEMQTVNVSTAVLDLRRSRNTLDEVTGRTSAHLAVLFYQTN